MDINAITPLVGQNANDIAGMYTQGVERLRGLASSADGVANEDALRKAAQDFESVLLHRLMEEMSRTIGHDELLSGPEMQQVQGIFWMHLAEDLADKGGMGLWKEIYRQMQPGQPNAQDGGAMELLR